MDHDRMDSCGQRGGRGESEGAVSIARFQWERERRPARGFWGAVEETLLSMPPAVCFRLMP